MTNHTIANVPPDYPDDWNPAFRPDWPEIIIILLLLIILGALMKKGR